MNWTQLRSLLDQALDSLLGLGRLRTAERAWTAAPELAGKARFAKELELACRQLRSEKGWTRASLQLGRDALELHLKLTTKQLGLVDNATALEALLLPEVRTRLTIGPETLEQLQFLLSETWHESLEKLPSRDRAALGNSLLAILTHSGQAANSLGPEPRALRTSLAWRFGIACLCLGVALGGLGSVLLRPVNLALHATATGSAAFMPETYKPQRLIDGNRTELAFHSTDQNRPWIQLDLGAAKKISKVRVFNRLDVRDRVVPLSVQVSTDGVKFKQVSYRTEPFFYWTARFRPVRARYVRLMIMRNSALMLNEVEVYK